VVALIGIVLGCFVASALMTGAYWRYAEIRGLFDHPNARSSHATPTPTGGGVGLVIVTLSCLVYLYLSGGLPSSAFKGMAGGGALIAAAGYLDDRRPLPRAWRLLIHVAAVAWLAYWVVGEIGVAGLGPWGGVPLALTGVFGLVWLINLYNFMDGIDSLAGVEAVSVTIGAGAILWSNGAMTFTPVLWCLAGAAAGFLVWNWPPARIFMGDTGSGFLGFLLGATAILTVGDGGITLWSWAILLGVFVVDATVTLLRRMLHGERWYEAHRTHAYQHAAMRWGSHRRVTVAVLIINVLWLWPLAWLVSQIQQLGVILATLAVTPLVALCLWLGAGRSEKSELTIG
jgi:Fuc2NAc and GlcNAc transferase